jgi:pimeloyl-ACP methyl ester carboxylesterase
MKNGESCIRIVTFSLLIVPVIAALGSDLTSQADVRIQWVKSKDGTPIAVECAGNGMMSPSEVAAMKSRPSWAGLAASVESQIRQIRALDEYRFDASRMSKLKVPTLVLTGSRTESSDLKRAISVLMGCLPNPTLVVIEGQEHNTMDRVPQQSAETVIGFLLNNKS